MLITLSLSLYIVVCSTACSRLILHLKESSRRACYRNQHIPSSWAPQLDFETLGARTAGRERTRSEIAFRFGYEGDSESESSSGGPAPPEEIAIASVGLELRANELISDPGSTSVAALPPPNQSPPSVSDGQSLMESTGGGA